MVNKYKGICFRKDLNKWRAYIHYNNKRINLGTFNKEIDANLNQV
ncbi:MAG: hypothetical protein DRH37_02915 [Deltaproteobacteria bacterium]|nr:MAG: hypothetical protein DRH37_02915 [Deltaproteobacteria bacterium]